MKLAAIVVSLCSAASAALAAAPPLQEYEFDVETVETDRDVPLDLVLITKPLGAGNLVRIRYGFVTEIVRSADAL